MSDSNQTLASLFKIHLTFVDFWAKGLLTPEKGEYLMSEIVKELDVDWDDFAESLGNVNDIAESVRNVQHRIYVR